MHPEQFSAMYYISQNCITTTMKMADIMQQNPYVLLMIQHFEIDFCVHDLSVGDICKQYAIHEDLFILVTNLYNGLRPQKRVRFSDDDALQIIRFLKNSHHYYRSEKYPEISSYISQLKQGSSDKEIQLLEKFFNEYFSEVIEHLDYEDNVAFPYFLTLINGNDNKKKSPLYSSKEYSEHHTDIELKLADLKSLLINHIQINQNYSTRRKLLTALFELEFDLYIHSLIEDTILIPLGSEKERKINA